jgi:hypothetical protein
LVAEKPQEPSALPSLVAENSKEPIAKCNASTKTSATSPFGDHGHGGRALWFHKMS